MMRSTIARLKKPLGPAVVPALIVIAIAIAISSFGGRATDQTLARSMCMMIVVVGTYVFVGNSGIISFGQISFMAIGAYATAILTMSSAVKRNFLPDLPPELLALQLSSTWGTIVALAVVSVIAVIVAIPLMRLSGLAAGIASLALLGMVYEIISNASGYTGGQQTLLGVARSPGNWVILIVLVGCLFAASVFQRSRFGLMLRASRDESNAAASLGVKIRTLRVYAFVLSAFIVGLGGSLYAQVLRTVSVSSFFIDMTATTLAMLVVGGMRSLFGAVTGVIVISFALELIRRLEQGTLIGGVTLPSGMTEVVVGVIMLAMLLLWPTGLTGGQEISIADLVSKKKQVHGALGEAGDEKTV